MKAGKYIALFMCCLVLFLGCAYIFVWSKNDGDNGNGNTQSANWYDLQTCEVSDPQTTSDYSSILSFVNSLKYTNNTVYKYTERYVSYSNNKVNTLSVLFKTNDDEQQIKNSILARIEQTKIGVTNPVAANRTSIVINTQVINNQRNVLISKNGVSTYFATEAEFKSSENGSDGNISSLFRSVAEDFEGLNNSSACYDKFIIVACLDEYFNNSSATTYKYAEANGTVKALVYTENEYMFIESINGEISKLVLDTKDNYVCVAKYAESIPYASDVEAFKKAK